MREGEKGVGLPTHMKEKVIIVSAPSGAGKTTIVKYLLTALPQLAFSISACSRSKREGEINGKDYYFMSVDEFRRRIENDEFVEWQEVYPGSYYGTLKNEIERIWEEAKVPIFEVDILGGINLKNYFKKHALSIFIRPPAFEDLEKRLRTRNTESDVEISRRVTKAEYELTFADQFDRVIVNDDLAGACQRVHDEVKNFIQ